ncbi:M23 family metallopeptidase [Mesorhizobium sp. CN2-181]|uniref:M23 family metallopeptidase n=1 Tax=Mesorhizobium yinganensis TaxID=3157707 RepID=UPI0032B866F9
MPAQCMPGKDCFVQQFADMDPGPAVIDPFCGSASYEGHDGIDLRILSMADVERGVPVIAMADGTVGNLRDGEPDHLMLTAADQQAVGDKECGNGVIIDQGGGLEVQYCHMRQGSIAVKTGDKVKRGQPIGYVGASGAAAFPHVHITVRRDGAALDPMTGHALSGGCLKEGEQAKPLFAPDVAASLGKGGPQLLGFGLAGSPVDYDALVVSGAPPAATAASANLVGWGWFINLRKGDRIYISLIGPDGNVFAESMSEELDRNKAAYSSFAGKRGTPKPGRYELTIKVLENMRPVLSQTTDITIE